MFRVIETKIDDIDFGRFIIAQLTWLMESNQVNTSICLLQYDYDAKGHMVILVPNYLTVPRPVYDPMSSSERRGILDISKNNGDITKFARENITNTYYGRTPSFIRQAVRRCIYKNLKIDMSWKKSDELLPPPFDYISKKRVYENLSKLSS